MAEVPSAGVEETDAAVARAKEAFPAWRAVAPADRAALLHRLADALAGRAGDLATLEARNAGKPIGDARGEMAMVVDTFRYYAAGPGAAAGPDDPGRRGRRHDLPRAARGGGPDRALELPAHDRLVEGGAGAGGGQHRGPEARRADPADRARAGADRARGRDPGGGAERGRRARAASAAGGSSSTPTWPRSPSPAPPRSGAGSPRAPRRRSSASPWSWAASPPTSCSPTPISSERPRRRRWPCSATRARTAARARGSWSRRRSSTASWRRSRRRSGRCGSATPSTRRRRWAR